jgi:sterol desaturase/sphingolipid hydroxylase (fatty acid hydroxylase superfamily)
MHKSTALWRFHKLHHAAKEFTILNGIRTSLSEHFLNKISIFVVLWILLGIPRPEIFYAVVFIRRIVDLLQHSDLPSQQSACRLRLKLWRYFSFWDYLFGTTSPRYRHSPLTADTCNLGLATEKESITFNRWKTVLINETIFQYAWATIRNFLNLKKA